ncbi:YceI family protein [Pseudoxanthomonas sp. PXM02]|uniref:YceI family protein n=1 Tax=Pseudoxanthomonas sp. PXM02 TaxID=2769294 RepID=UPI00178626E7|nr:YceI family protein [Pseudoxanthomonas sp. PXM02]MBD9479515.1 polyisoprenoid-binding protein [Pseudoxanthomonas sp. PXM02]
MRSLCLLALLPATAFARDTAAEYRLDPVHTRVMFAISHAGFSNAIGTVSGSTGTVVFDPDDWTRARVDVRIPIARADLGDADWNKATLAKSLLDAEGHPEARFVSTRVEPVDATHARVYGDLSLRGVTREVVLDVTLNAAKRHPMPPFRRTVGFSATTKLSRADFGITAWKSVIGDEVELRIEAEATYDGKADDDTAPATPPSPSPQEPTP